MLSRVILAIVVGIIVAVVFYIVGVLLLPIAVTIATILINISYGAGIVAALLFFFSGRPRPLAGDAGTRGGLVCHQGADEPHTIS